MNAKYGFVYVDVVQPPAPEHLLRHTEKGDYAIELKLNNVCFVVSGHSLFVWRSLSDLRRSRLWMIINVGADILPMIFFLLFPVVAIVVVIIVHLYLLSATCMISQ